MIETKNRNKTKQKRTHAWVIKDKETNRFYSRYSKSFTTSKIFESNIFENREDARTACKAFAHQFKPVKAILTETGFPQKELND